MILGTTDIGHQISWLMYEYVFENIFYGIDWIYCYSDIHLAFDYVIKYLFINDMFFGYFSNLFLQLYWFNTFVSPDTSFAAAIFLDMYELAKSYSVHFSSYWFKSFLGPHEISLFAALTPEMVLLSEGVKNHLYEDSVTNFFVAIISNEFTESLVSPISLFLNLIVTLFLVTILSSFFFSFFGSHTTDENLIDHDYTLNSLLVESEEEIGSLDDMFMAGLIFFFVFGWYFYFNCLLILTWLPETALIIYLFPAIYYIIICIPTFLLYDFGIFFLAYLRGVGPSSVLIFELVFDYIAFMAFYIRLCVQGVRLILMTFVYVSLHDLILLSPVNSELFVGNESLMETLGGLSLTYESFSYFFLSKLPAKILYWIYELAHTFFVVTAQFIAFFAMVFWLFFFLYTFFVFEKFEAFFVEKREERHNKLKTLLFYKQD